MTETNNLTIGIADILIKISSDNQLISLRLDEYYHNFSVKKNGNYDILVEIFNGIPEKYSRGELIFDSSLTGSESIENHSDYQWNIYMCGDEKAISLAEKSHPDKQKIVAVEGAQKSSWQVYYEYQEKPVLINPMEYPLGVLILHYIVNVFNGVLMHAAAVSDKQKGYLFCGFSGKGKTTMVKLWKKSADIINDDRLVIRKKKSRFKAYNTPLYDSDSGSEVDISAIFIIYHSSENKSKRLYGANAVAKLFSNCIQHNYTSSQIDNILNVLKDVVDCIPVYELGFRKDKSILPYIQKLANSDRN